MTINKLFNKRKITPSDINEHLATLYYYACLPEVNIITELGTRFGDSTCAFLSAIHETEKTLHSYDLFRSDIIDEFQQYKNFKFTQGDSLSCNINQTDMLFIDTLHVYFQLFSELSLHSKMVKRYILLHDTTTFKLSDEHYYGDNCVVKMSNLVVPTKKQGLSAAIQDFIDNGEDGKFWKVKEVFTNNNGLTVLERINL